MKKKYALIEIKKIIELNMQIMHPCQVKGG